MRPELRPLSDAELAAVDAAFGRFVVSLEKHAGGEAKAREMAEPFIHVMRAAFVVAADKALISGVPPQVTFLVASRLLAQAAETIKMGDTQ